MRMLAIRGLNLASLGAFEVDLSTPPLAGPGLFVVTGETGAGKTTILDAATLALYGDYPRVAGAGNARVPDPSGQSLTHGDARGVLRRGTGHGHAEVDFVGADGNSYRARWGVARARGRAEGRFQNATRILSRIGDGAVVAEGAVEVDAEVPRLTGLSYQQFVRSVLLPQGAFDAFLTAPEPERALVLERITDTGSYASLSAALHRGTEQRRTRVQALRDRLADVGVLPPEDRAALEVALDALRKDLGVLATERGALAEAVRRAKRVAEGEELARLAQAALDAARLASADAATDRAWLAEVDSAEPLRRLGDNLRTAALADRSARQDLGDVEAMHARLSDLSGQAEARLAEARSVLAEADEVVERHVPIWAEAGRLDAACVAAAHDVRTATAARDGAARALNDARSKVDIARCHLEGLEHRQVEVTVRLWETEAHDVLVEDLSRLQSVIEAYVDAAARGVVEAKALIGLEALAVSHRSDLEVAEAARIKDAEERSLLDASLEGLRSRRNALNLPGLLIRQDELNALRTLLTDAHQDHRAHVNAALRHAAAADELARAEGDATEAEVSLRAAGDRCAILRAERRGLTVAAARAEDAASAHAASLRATLLPGEPCPVCGSPEHRPYASSELDRLALDLLHQRDDMDAAIELASAEGEAAARSRAEATGRASAARDRATAALSDVAGSVAAFDARRPALVEALSTCGLQAEIPGIGADDARVAWIAVSEVVCTLRATLARDIGEAERLGTGIELAIEQRDAATSRMEVSVVEVELATRDLHEVDLQVREAGVRQQDATRRAEACLGSLQPCLDLLGTTLESFASDPISIGRHVAGLASVRQALRAEAVTLASDVGLGAAGLDAALEATRVADEAHSRSGALLLDATKLFDEVSAERSGMLGGMPTATHRAGLEERARSAREAEATARTECALATRDAAAGAERLLATRAAASLAARLHGEANLEVADACARLGITPERVTNVLGRDPGAIASTRIRLAELATALRDGERALDTRSRDLRQAREAASGTAVPDGAADALRALDEAVDVRTRQVGVQEERLRRDGEERLRASGLEADLALLVDDHATWAEVDAAIGSANGDAFRRVAQEITLDALVALANEQLGALAPRYRLVRGDGLALHVSDMDMGGEVRASRSLSGGERFLVSLGLALALSGLEGNRGSCDVLLIDEGFGSLDGGSLDVAVEALETLQGLGRKVGVVTHVVGMVERIPTRIVVTKRGGGRSVVEVSAV